MKRIGKIVLIVFAVLVLLGALSSACSKSSPDSASSAAVQASSSNTPTSAEAESTEVALSESANTEAVFLGTWDMTQYKYENTNLGKEELKAARDQGSDSYLVINEDGGARIVVKDDVSDFTWEATSTTSLKLKYGYRYLTGTLKGDELVFEFKGGALAFERGEPRSSLPTASSGKVDTHEGKIDSSATPVDGGEVSPDLKEMLDSYEAFMDEYVEFMNSYNESGDTMSMLSQYTEYLQKYSDLVQKIDSVDTSNMSAADYAYYIEVTSRVSQKLLEASVL